MSSRRRFRGPRRSEFPGGPLRGASVGALAIGDSRANAVGPVRLTCEANGLRIDLFGVGRFSAGFAFATLADAVSFRVPYRAVRGMVRDGRSLMLSLDPQAAAPYSRFALIRFSKEPMETLMRAFRARAMASWASYALPLPLALAAAYTLYSRELAGPVGLSAVALITAFLCHRALTVMVGWVSWGGPLSDRLRDAFERTVSAELGLERAPELLDHAHPGGRQRPPGEAAARPAQAMGAVLRPVAFALVGTVAIAAAGASVLAVKAYGVADSVVLPVDDARTGIGPPVRAVVAAGLAEGATKNPSCECSLVDSVLWRGGLPQLSILVSPVSGELDAVWLELEKTYPIRYAARQRPRAEIDLAVVNNSAQTLKTLDLVLTFAFRDERGKRRNLRERGLHWPAKLGPGESVKWRVTAPGTELKIETRHTEKLKDVGSAGAEVFYALSKAKIPVVRLHGAMMLAMLRDARAPALAAAAGALSPVAARARAELSRTMSPLAVCDVVPSAEGLTACLFNGSSKLLRTLTVVSTDATGEAQRHEVSDFFHPGVGLRVRVPLPSEGRTVGVEALGGQ